MASLIGEMSSTEEEVERRGAQGMLENRNGSEVLVVNEQDSRTSPEHASDSKQTTHSPRKVLTPLPKYLQEQIRRLTTSPSAAAFVTSRHELRPPTDDVPLVGLGQGISSTPTRYSAIHEGKAPSASIGCSSIEPSSTGSGSDYVKSKRENPGSSGLSGSSARPPRRGLRVDRNARRRREERKEIQRREARDEARWQAERADRQAERQAAEDREDRRAALRAEERREDRAQALQIATLGRAPHRLGAALATLRSFDGAHGADGAAYFAEFTTLLGTHSIPPEMRAKEFFLKLQGKAARWYASVYHDLPAGEFPSFGIMSAAFLQEYSPRYQAADAFQALQNVTRKPGTTGQEALQGLAELELRLRRLGVDNPGPHEQLAYRLQNLLSVPELHHWTSLANACDISDDALNKLELHSSVTPLSRHSCSSETRETFFTRRGEHLRNFLRDQGKAIAGSSSSGSAPARAAVINPAEAGPSPARTLVVPPPSSFQPTTMDGEITMARLAAVRQWDKFENRKAPPPEYFGPNKDPKHLAANLASFTRRSENKACFRCPEDKLVPGQPQWDCRYHGVGALEADFLTCPSIPGTAPHHGRRRS